MPYIEEIFFMKKNSCTESEAKELIEFRREIDVLDNQIIELLQTRLNVVQKVGEYKKRTSSKLCPIRPGREASMLRRIAKSFTGSTFSPAAAAQLWRIIIGTSTALEAKLTISVYAPDDNRDLFWLAREYFGPAATITRQPHAKRVIGDVIDGSAAVGIIPPLSADIESNWWSHLLQAGADNPKIFAHLPFVYHNEDRKNFPSALAFSRVLPEDSGDDMSVFVLQAEHNVSQHRLQTELNNAGLSAHWLNIGSLSANERHHVIELKGFITPDHTQFQQFLATMGKSIPHVYFLGAYATPFTLKEEHI